MGNEPVYGQHENESQQGYRLWDNPVSLKGYDGKYSSASHGAEGQAGPVNSRVEASEKPKWLTAHTAGSSICTARLSVCCLRGQRTAQINSFPFCLSIPVVKLFLASKEKV